MEWKDNFALEIIKHRMHDFSSGRKRKDTLMEVILAAERHIVVHEEEGLDIAEFVCFAIKLA